MHQVQDSHLTQPLVEAVAAAVARTGGPVMKAIPGAAPTAAPVRRDVAAPLARLRGLILLAGSVRPSPLSQATGRSVLSLPLADGHTLLDVWRRNALVLAGRAKLDRLPVRIIVDRSSAAPALGSEDIDAGIRVEVDPVELRGTGGVLRDVCGHYADDDYVLVGSAAQLLTESLADLAFDLADRRSDLAVLAHADDTAGTLMLVRCGCLRDVNPVGFVDMKEQAIPLLARNHAATVVRRERAVEMRVRTLADYVAALRLHHGQLAGQQPDGAEVGGTEVGDDPFAERWQSAGAVVEAGAAVDPSATLHDSVVLAGGVVERNAVLVRSVVCAGGVVRRDRVVVDQFVNPKREKPFRRRPQ